MFAPPAPPVLAEVTVGRADGEGRIKTCPRDTGVSRRNANVMKVAFKSGWSEFGPLPWPASGPAHKTAIADTHNVNLAETRGTGATHSALRPSGGEASPRPPSSLSKSGVFANPWVLATLQ